MKKILYLILVVFIVQACSGNAGSPDSEGLSESDEPVCEECGELIDGDGEY